MNNDKQSEPAAPAQASGPLDDLLAKYGKHCPRCHSGQISSDNSTPLKHRCLDCGHKFVDSEAIVGKPAQASGPTAKKIASALNLVELIWQKLRYRHGNADDKKVAAEMLLDYAARQSERVRQLEHELTSRKATQAELHRKHNELQRKLELASGYVANREQNEQAEREINGPSPAEHRLQEMQKAGDELVNLLLTTPMKLKHRQYAAPYIEKFIAVRTEADSGLDSEQAKAKEVKK
jgi:hypothetical protein